MTGLRIALVDDHELVAVAVAESLRARAQIDVVAIAPTVAGLRLHQRPVELVVLDLRLSDGSSPAENVSAVRSTGAKVLILTAADDPHAVRAAVRAGALGIIRKAQPVDVLVEAIRDASAGHTVASVEWAAALDADLAFTDAGLSPREREVLALYASGEKAAAVASITGLSRATVANYVARIRTKYELAGRPARTKVDLYRRAAEDGLLDDGP